MPGLVGLAGGFSSIRSDLDAGAETRTRLGSVVGDDHFARTPGFCVSAAFGSGTGSAELTRQDPVTPFLARAEPFANWTGGVVRVDSYDETNQGEFRLSVDRQPHPGHLRG